MKKRTPALCLPLGPLELRLYQRYLHGVRRGSREPYDQQVVLWDGQVERAVHSVADIRAGAPEAWGALPARAAEDPEGFATIVGALLGPCHVIASAELYCFLEDHFLVRVEDQLPRVNGTSLWFLLGTFHVGKRHELWSMEVDLVSGRIGAVPVPRRYGAVHATM